MKDLLLHRPVKTNRPHNGTIKRVSRSRPLLLFKQYCLSTSYPDYRVHLYKWIGHEWYRTPVGCERHPFSPSSRPPSPPARPPTAPSGPDPPRDHRGPTRPQVPPHTPSTRPARGEYGPDPVHFDLKIKRCSVLFSLDLPRTLVVL